MSIVTLNKVTLCGLSAEKAAVLDDLQSLGCLHLRSLRPPPREPETAAPEGAEDVHRALRYLLETPVKRRQISPDMLDDSAGLAPVAAPNGSPSNADGAAGESGNRASTDSHLALSFDLPKVVFEVLSVKQQERDCSDRCDFLRQRIKQLEPWGDFSLPEGQALDGYKLWFYLLPLHQLKQLPKKDLVWQVVHQDNRYAYVVVIATEEPPANALVVPRVHTGALSLSAVRRQLHQAQIEYEEIIARRQALTRWILLLATKIDRAEDRAARIHAAGLTLDHDGVFAVQGWIAASDRPRLKTFAERHQLALLVQPAAAAERPPTLLDNPRLLAGGEDVVRFYQTPAYGGWDPSLVLFFSLALFFAMILSDAGYGLVLAIALLAMWKKMGRSATGLRLRVLGAVLVASTVAWGVLAGSYFGAAPPPDSLLAACQLLDLRDFDSMMRLSVVIGVAHLSLANLAMAWQYRRQTLALSRLGWVVAAAGGLALWLDTSNTATSGLMTATGPWLLGVGLLAVLLFSAEPSGHDGWSWRLLAGLKGLTGISRIFGDVLSYLRLFALGLASASLALTFNQLAAQVSAAVPGIGMLLSLLILLLGHGLNLALAVMSGLVHGLRLNFIEFYNWGLSDEGYPFRAFAKKARQNNAINRGNYVYDKESQR